MRVGLVAEQLRQFGAQRHDLGNDLGLSLALPLAPRLTKARQTFSRTARSVAKCSIGSTLERDGVTA